MLTEFEFNKTTKLARKQFAGAIKVFADRWPSLQKAFLDALRPAIEAAAEFCRQFKSNRRIRRAIRTHRWSKAGWYIADHRRRSEARTPIWEEFNEIVTAAPDKALSSLPVDGAERHDAYVVAGSGRAQT